jgi:hypothetical protein
MKIIYYKNQEIFNRAIGSLLKWKKRKITKKLIFKKTKVLPEFQNYIFKFRFKSKEKYPAKILKINKIYSKKKILSYLEWVIKINSLKRKILEKTSKLSKNFFLKTEYSRELKFFTCLLFFFFRNFVLNC